MHLPPRGGTSWTAEAAEGQEEVELKISSYHRSQSSQCDQPSVGQPMLLSTENSAGT